jgi:formylglycine-generating enzyme required for sulfatase activity
VLLRIIACTTALAAFASAQAAGARSNEPVPVHGGVFATVLPPAPGAKQVRVADFQLDRTPVTNRDFARFVARSPQWRRDRVPQVFADQGYLMQWQSATQPGKAIEQQPVVQVSWFAASAYCEARNARLPLWHEWEFAAAASATAADARKDEAWRQQILSWYSRPALSALPNVGASPPNYYGIQDLHGLVWEWVDDIASLLVSGDNRQTSEPNALRFCGPGALSLEQKENYAVLMRIAMLSSMQAQYTSSTMGFRCASEARRSTP